MLKELGDIHVHVPCYRLMIHFIPWLYGAGMGEWSDLLHDQGLYINVSARGHYSAKVQKKYSAKVSC